MSNDAEQVKDDEFEEWWQNNLEGCPDPQKFVAQDAWEAAKSLWQSKAEMYMEIMDAVAKDSDKAQALLRWAETEMRYAGWNTRINDQHGRTDVYEAIVDYLYGNSNDIA